MNKGITLAWTPHDELISGDIDLHNKYTIYARKVHPSVFQKS